MKVEISIPGVQSVIALVFFASMAFGQDYPSAVWNPADANNYAVASRSAPDIRWIVIHTTEDAPGSDCSVSQNWFKNPNQNGDGSPGVSAHYVICRDGTVVQMVRDKDIAYHAGNLAYNQQSIGIEHERHDTSNWTEAQFQASGQLVRWLVSHYSIQSIFPSGIAPANPSDGSGIIGHTQVPAPNTHTDPVNWDWPHYQTLFINSNFTLRIVPAVQVNWSTTTNRAYQLLTAAAVGGPYLPTGGLIEGTGGEVASFSEAAAARQFFRVQDTLSSGVTSLEGIWEGQTYQAGFGAGSYTTRICISNSNRVFTGFYSNDTFECATTLTLSEPSDTQARFFEFTTDPDCINSVVILTRVNATNIIYNAYPEGDPTGALVFGTLRKR